MASPNSTFTEMVTTTLRNHPTEIADNVSTHNALYNRLKARGKIKLVSGGYEIVRPLDHASNATIQRYSGYDTLSVGESDVLTAAKYDWVQMAVNVVASGRELRMNSGREQLIDLADARTTNAMRTATYTMWKNQYFECSTAPTKSTIKTHMNVLWLKCVRGNDKPDLIPSSHDFFGFYWESLQDLQRYASADNATAGFQSLKYVTADVIFDTNTNFSTTAEIMYYVNTNYLELVAHRDANWAILDEKMSVNQDAVVIPIIWMGQLVCSNRALQGKLIDEA